MNHEELTLIKQAIISEIEGYEFYKMAAQQAEGEIKEAFLELADEELKHLDWLKTLFNASKSETDDFDLAMLEEPPAPRIFRWENLDRKHAGVAVSVFGIGMQMEEAAVKFYTHAREKCTDVRAKKLFDTLIGWEKGHYEQFEKEYFTQQQSWWDEQGFAPF